jgi:hypothetical protein
VSPSGSITRVRIASSKLVPSVRAIPAATNQKPLLQYEKSSPTPTGRRSGSPSVSSRRPESSSGSGHSAASPPWWLSSCLTVASMCVPGGGSSRASKPSWTSVIASVAVKGFVIEAIRNTVSGVAGCGRPSSCCPSAAMTISPSRSTPAARPGTFHRSRASAANSASFSGESRSIKAIATLLRDRGPGRTRSLARRAETAETRI